MGRPTVAEYIAFLRNVVGIPATVLPDNSQWIAGTYELALEVVNRSIKLASSNVYSVAVYNLGTDLLINWCQDDPTSSDPTFFSDLRAQFSVNNFVPGVLSESHDESTGQHLLNPDFMKGLQLGDLSNMKTPFGRAYLGIAQMYGPTIWGIT